MAVAAARSRLAGHQGRIPFQHAAPGGTLRETWISVDFRWVVDRRRGGGAPGRFVFHGIERRFGCPAQAAHERVDVYRALPVAKTVWARFGRRYG